MTWYLILTVLTGYAASQTSTPFKTEEACEAAANKIKSDQGSFVISIRYSCVKDN